MRGADKRHLSPSRYLGLPWKKWGETDFLLTQALDCIEENTCSCGCGGWRPECCGDDPNVKCVVEATICRGGEAIAAWHKANPEPPPGAMVEARFVNPDEAQSNEQRFQSDLIAMLRRHGQEIPPDLLEPLTGPLPELDDDEFEPVLPDQPKTLAG